LKKADKTLNIVRLSSYILILAVGCIGIWQLDVPHGKIPALGKLLNPFTGFWQNAEPTTFQPEPELQIPGLKGNVEVVYDDRLVPHIYAENLEDLYFAQGYITASHRLWQMEIQTHSAAGRLSEILGPDLLERDRMSRRIGLPYAAEKAVESYNKEGDTYEAIMAYTAGVNAYIETLEPKDYPVEYKILGYAPEKWEPVKTALLLKYMSNVLTGTEDDFEHSNFVAKYGSEYFEDFYGYFWEVVDPIIPVGEGWWSDSSLIDADSILNMEAALGLPTEDGDPMWGSNNWAIAPEKTANGNPILANDPHLNMTLPAIWFEVHLNAPGMNVYGVSLPGAPAVIIGFNDDVAWGVTNSSRDVKDWYAITFDGENKDKYLLDGQWQNTEYRIDEIAIKGRDPYFDTVAYTYWGPVVSHPNLEFSGPQNHALRWTAHDPSDELQTFMGLNTAKNHEDYLEAVNNFRCPGQNFVFASREGDIAIKQQGKFPIKREWQGWFLQDGSTTATEWDGFIPVEENPHVLNPERGFVSSANQQAVDSTYPYHIGGIYEHYRNRRINSQLEQMQGITLEDMQRLQLDNYNWQASEALPIMLAHLPGDIDPELTNLLSGWDYYNNADLFAPAVYELWWDSLYVMIWDEFMEDDGLKAPSSFYTTEMLNRDLTNPFFDIASTVEQEDFMEVNRLAFEKAASAFRDMDEPDWGTAKATDIRHLGLIPAFGRYSVYCGGNKHIVNATGKYAGPSWRMVVELGPEMRPTGIYPGGQSGNPGSPYYDNFIDDWSAGKHYDLLFLNKEEWTDEQVLARQTLKAK
jgi:penicillin amidase